jgi:type II secretory pathway predicted ATPase ExeA
MYERFYHLRERPFSLTPDPDYLYLSRVHREALNHLRYGIASHAGFVVITGEIGCGKTTMSGATTSVTSPKRAWCLVDEVAPGEVKISSTAF